MYQFDVVTLFPGMFDAVTESGVTGRARERRLFELVLWNPRDFAANSYRTVDDRPYGGGPGMVMMVEPLAAALRPLAGTHRVLFTPAGEPLNQATLDNWAKLEELTLVCGRFEGVDQRVVDLCIDQEVSLGDYVLAGGEAAAAAVIEGVARLLPGVVGNPESTESESFRGGLLEEPVYTRPAVFEGMEVPEVLLSGDHGRIEAWRREQRLRRTEKRRPDLLPNGTDSVS